MNAERLAEIKARYSKEQINPEGYAVASPTAEIIRELVEAFDEVMEQIHALQAELHAYRMTVRVLEHALESHGTPANEVAAEPSHIQPNFGALHKRRVDLSRSTELGGQSLNAEECRLVADDDCRRCLHITLEDFEKILAELGGDHDLIQERFDFDPAVTEICNMLWLAAGGDE